MEVGCSTSPLLWAVVFDASLREAGTAAAAAADDGSGGGDDTSLFVLYPPSPS